MTRPIDDTDATTLPADHLARQDDIRCLLIARLHTSSESFKAALAMAVWLVEHPEACATADDYPGWAAQFAALQAARQPAPAFPHPTAEEASHG